MAIEKGGFPGLIPPMAQTTEQIARRLTQLLEALKINAAELCRQTGLSTNRWSQYETAERRITLDAALILCDRYGITLDWIYFGDISGMPQRLISKMREDA